MFCLSLQVVSPEGVKKVQNVVEQNGFVAIDEENLKVEEDGDGWETVCYRKKNRTPEKCCGESSESSSRDMTHDNEDDSKVKRPVAANVDLAPVQKRLILENGSSSDKESRSSLILGDDTAMTENTAGTSIGRQERCNENVYCNVNDSVSPSIDLQTNEDKEFTNVNENGYIGDPTMQLEKSEKFEALKGFLSPLNIDSDVDTDCEDGLTASDVEHQKALSAAIEQEADLSKEYEKEKEMFLASAIEHEEKLAKEIADQEAYVNAMKEDVEVDEDDDEEEEVAEQSEGNGNKEEKADDEKVNRKMCSDKN